jgi:hypothetical protein
MTFSFLLSRFFLLGEHEDKREEEEEGGKNGSRKILT